jgi:metal-sulfur cluster biosynthetic enzyme
VEQVKEAVKTMVPSVTRVDVDLVFDPPWTPDRMVGEAQ